MARSLPAAVPDDDLFEMRLQRSADDLWPMLEALFAGHPAWQDFRHDLLSALRRGWRDRPAELKRRDLQRDLEPRLVPAARHGGSMSSTSTASPGR